jgi:hypothetical protein
MKSAAPLAAVAPEAPRARQRRVAAASDIITQHRQQPQVSELVSSSADKQHRPISASEEIRTPEREPSQHRTYKPIPRGLPSWLSWLSWLSEEGKNYLYSLGKQEDWILE